MIIGETNMTKEQIQEKIAKLETELQELKSELIKPEKFEFNLEKGYRIYSNEVSNKPEKQNKDKHLLRKVFSNASMDYHLMQETLIIGAIAEQLDPDYKSKLDWDDEQPKYFICLYTPGKTYYVNTGYTERTLGVVHMPKDLADKVCEILNNKEIDLS